VKSYLLVYFKTLKVEPVPFLLTVPNARRFPEPNVLISTNFKAKPIPKSHTKGTGEQEALVKKKEARVVTRTREFAMTKRNAIKKDQALKEARIRVTVKIPPLPAKRAVARTPNFKMDKPPQQPIKLTTATILREDALVQKKKKIEQDTLEQAAISLTDPNQFKSKLRLDKEKEDAQKQLHKKKMHLSVLLSHEEAYLAKQEIILGNRFVYNG
jgi:hypothetical protein